MRFEWDDDKNRSNFIKHKVWFEEAQTVWSDHKSVEFFDSKSSMTEERYIRVGLSKKLNILLIVFCERHNGEIIRIISARKTTKKEHDQYYEERI